MNTKKISELTQLDNLSENTNVLVENDGETMRFPAKNIGAVKTVNGESPDESGNVELVIPEGFSGSWNDLTDKPDLFSGSWNDLTDKPFGEESSVETIVERTTQRLILEGIYNTWHYVEFAQTIPLGTETICTFNGEQYTGVLAEHTGINPYTGEESHVIGFGNPKMVLHGVEDTGENYFVRYAEPSSGAAIGVVLEEEFYDTVLKVEARTTKIVPLDEKYIPDTIARVEDIPEVPEHTWESLPDKPFGEIENKTILFPEAELVNGTNLIFMEGHSFDNVVVGKTVIVVYDGVEYTVKGDQEFTTSEERLWYGNPGLWYPDASSNGLPFIFHIDGGSFMFRCGGDNNISHTVVVYEIDTEIMKLDSTYLPKAEAVSDVTAAPTADEFNALLASLRAAGYLAE